MALPPQDGRRRRHSSHWGAFNALVEDGRLVDVEAFERDPNPSPIIDSIPAAVYSPTRVRRPAIRKSWLEGGPGTRTSARGSDPFVEVEWEEALDLLAAELERVRETHGNAAIFGGSYGWSSAGRFHHAKTQLQRFLGAFGGYTDQVHTYSNAAGHAILPYIFGDKTLARGPFTDWNSIAEHCDLFVSFGGLGLKNTQVEPGGMGEHGTLELAAPAARTRASRSISITPNQATTAADYLGARVARAAAQLPMWLLMLGVAYARPDQHSVAGSIRDFVDTLLRGVSERVPKPMSLGRTRWTSPRPRSGRRRSAMIDEAEIIRRLAERMCAVGAP